MKISGFEKLSLQDYPNHISCIIFTKGCNFKCPFCQNSTLIPFDKENLIDEQEIFKYLNLRKGILNGVTISGGEPTIQPDLKSFIKEVKKLNLDVKLDTNGSNPSILQELLDEHLVDYVAMDIKNTWGKYPRTSGIESINISCVQNSINLILQSTINYEFRTTVTNEHHTLQDILEIIKIIGDSKYYIQNFRNSECVLDKSLTELSSEKLNLWNEVLKHYANVSIR